MDRYYFDFSENTALNAYKYYKLYFIIIVINYYNNTYLLYHITLIYITQ